MGFHNEAFRYKSSEMAAPQQVELVPLQGDAVVDRNDPLLIPRTALVPDGVFLTRRDVPQIVPDIFKESDVYQKTAQALGLYPETSRDGRSRAIHIQSGSRGYVFLLELAHTKQDKKYGILYLSRGPIDSPLGQQNIFQYDGLRAMHDRFNTQLLPAYRNKYKVVRPFALGNALYKGRRYPYYTTEYIPEPYGELRISGVEMPMHKGLVVPKFELISPPTEIIRRTHAPQNERAKAAARFLSGTQLSDDDYYGALAIQQQIGDAFKATALMFRMYGGFPSEFKFNAGDLMASIAPDGDMSFYWTALRGGKTLFPDEGTWIEYMSDHTDLPHDTFSRTMKGVFNPFQTIDNMLATLYAETSSYILDAKTAAKKVYEERILKK